MNIKDRKAKIILSGSLTTARRFVKQQNLQGVPAINFSLYSFDTLVKEKLIRIKPDYHLISNDECAYIILSLIRDNDYKLKNYVTSFGAASTLLDVLNDYRYNENSSYQNLIDAEYGKLLEDYFKALEENSSLDNIEALKLLMNNKQNEDCYILSDLHFRPLEKKVVESMFNQIEYIEEKNNDYQIEKVFSCYGQYDEVANVLSYIEENKIPTGDVEVLYSEVIYENYIKGLCSARNVPHVMKSLHAKSSNYVSFIYDILTYIKNDNKYELLENILSNQALDGIYLEEFYSTLSFPKYVVGYSRKRSKEFIKEYKNDSNVAHFIELFNDLLEINENGLDYEKLLGFAKKYVKASGEISVFGNLVYNLSNLVKLENNDDKKIVLIQDLLNNLTYSEDDVDNAIVFSPINKSFTLRKYIFVLGVNQTSLLGSDVENAFIKDINDYKNELILDTDIHISEYQKTRKINNLKFYLSNSNSTIFLSFSSYDKINLKDMTEGVRLVTDKLVTVTEVNRYRVQAKEATFINNLSQNNEDVKPQYDNGVIVTEAEKQTETALPVDTSKDFKLSPSAVADLINCPFIFYYQKVLKIPCIEYPSLDEAGWLEPNKKGDMFHRTMELYFDNFINVPVVFDINKFEEAFATALKEAEQASPINNVQIYEEEKNEVKKVSKRYIEKLVNDNFFNQYKVLENEYELKKLNFHYPKEDKLILHGNVDRVDGYVDDNKVLHLRVVDYKSGNAKTEKDNHYYQHVLYPYVLKEGLKQLLKNQKCLFGLSYVDVVVDLFIYDFTFAGSKLEYLPVKFDVDSPDYTKVFTAIDKVVLSFLNGGQNLVDIMNQIFYASSVKGDRCKYCRYTKECIKKYEWGC